MTQKITTIHDVAHKAGVSISTVSKAFNNTGSLSPATRKKVLEIAAGLHFTPNALIRSLRKGATQVIGIYTWPVRSKSTHNTSLTLLEGITDGLEEARYDSLLYSQFPERRKQLTPSIFLDGRIDGLIISDRNLDLNGLKALANAGLPVVALYRPPSATDAPVGLIDIDNRHGIKEAVSHLVCLNHRNIAFYSPYATFNAIDRCNAFQEAMHSHQILLDPAWLIPGEQCRDTHNACSYLLSLPNRPTAIVACDDFTAFYVIEDLKNRGISVPREMSVIGFDNSPAATASPGLTTITHPAKDVGILAAQFITEMIGGKPAAECRKILPVELVIRNTTAYMPSP